MQDDASANFLFVRVTFGSVMASYCRDSLDNTLKNKKIKK